MTLLRPIGGTQLDFAVHIAFDPWRILYWRTHKCASSSAGDALLRWGQETCGAYAVPIGRARTFIERGYRIVGMKRHPLARMVSAFHSPSFHGFADFGSLVRAAAETPDLEIDQHLRSQTFLLPETAELHPMESLPEAWDAVRAAFVEQGAPEPPGLGRRNRSAHGPWEAFYDQDLRASAEGRYWSDLKRLGYGLESCDFA